MRDISDDLTDKTNDRLVIKIMITLIIGFPTLTLNADGQKAKRRNVGGQSADATIKTTTVKALIY